MTISEYISTIVAEGQPTAHFSYGRNHDFNIVGDNMPSEVVLCIEPDQGFLNLSSNTGYITDGYNLFIRFIQLIPAIGIAEKAPTREDAISAQKINATKFLSKLSNDDLFKDIASPTPWVAVIEAYDGNWFGVEINIRNLETITPLDVC